MVSKISQGEVSPAINHHLVLLQYLFFRQETHTRRHVPFWLHKKNLILETYICGAVWQILWLRSTLQLLVFSSYCHANAIYLESCHLVELLSQCFHLTRCPDSILCIPFIISFMVPFQQQVTAVFHRSPYNMLLQV